MSCRFCEKQLEIIRRQSHMIEGLQKEVEGLRDIIDGRMQRHRPNLQRFRALQQQVFEKAKQLIEESPGRRVHQSVVASHFRPHYQPETIKRRVQELCEQGLLRRLGKGEYTL